MAVVEGDSFILPIGVDDTASDSLEKTAKFAKLLGRATEKLAQKMKFLEKSMSSDQVDSFNQRLDLLKETATKLGATKIDFFKQVSLGASAQTAAVKIATDTMLKFGKSLTGLDVAFSGTGKDVVLIIEDFQVLSSTIQTLSKKYKRQSIST